MNRAEITAHAEAVGWCKLASDGLGDVWMWGDDPEQYMFLMVAYYDPPYTTESVSLDQDETVLVVPFKQLFHELKRERTEAAGAILRWWLDGNDGGADEWWDQLTDEQKGVYRT